MEVLDGRRADGPLVHLIDLGGVDPPFLRPVSFPDELGGLVGREPAVSIGVGMMEQGPADPMVHRRAAGRSARPALAREPAGAEVGDGPIVRAGTLGGSVIRVPDADRHGEGADQEEQPAEQGQGILRPRPPQRAEPVAGQGQGQADHQRPHHLVGRDFGDPLVEKSKIFDHVISRMFNNLIRPTSR
jgi:hypothetical protein